jgi:hypothetical protein
MWVNLLLPAWLQANHANFNFRLFPAGRVLQMHSCVGATPSRRWRGDATDGEGSQRSEELADSIAKVSGLAHPTWPARIARRRRAWT